MNFLELATKCREPSTPTVEVTVALLDELKALEPGRAMQLTGKDGRQYIIMDADEFERIAALAGLRLSR